MPGFRLPAIPGKLQWRLDPVGEPGGRVERDERDERSNEHEQHDPQHDPDDAHDRLPVVIDRQALRCPQLERG